MKGEEKAYFGTEAKKASDGQYYACNYVTGKAVRLGAGQCNFEGKTVEFNKIEPKDGVAYQCVYSSSQYKMLIAVYGKNKFIQCFNIDIQTKSQHLL